MTTNLKRILYVEDDPNIAEVAIMTLEDFGDFDVHHCSSGIDAINTLPKYQPQLLLMDVMMPGMDGPETLSRIRKTEGGKNIPVIFMTAKAQTHEQQSYIEMGAVGVIVKPFDPETLCETLNAFWKKAHE